MDIIYTLDILSAAPSGGIPLQDLGIKENIPKWSNSPTNTILTVGYNLSNLGIKHEEIQISLMLANAISSGYIILYGDGVQLQSDSSEVAFSGNASQYVRGDGSLGNFQTSFGTGGGGVSYYLNGGVSADVATYYEMSKIANLGANTDFPKVGDGLITQFITDSNQPNILTIPGGNWSCGIYASMSANGGTPAIYLELLKYDGVTFTSIATSSNEVITGGNILDLYTLTIPVPTTALVTTDRLAIRIYAVNAAGKTTTIHTQDSHLCEISTTFSTGMSALNTLTSPTQYFSTGTSGSNFGISSLGETHTFNLPIASATNTGKLSSSDWSTFNNKQNAITVLPIAQGGTNSNTALNNNRIIVSSAGALVEAATLANGQLLIGSTGSAPVASTLSQGTGVTITNAAGSVTIRKTVLDNLSATADPTVNDDSGDGYSVGSLWVNTTTKKSFICVDATLTTAVWGAATSAGGGSVSPTFSSAFAADNKNYILGPNMNANSTWFTIAQILFPGSAKFGNIREVYMNIWRTSGSANYSIRLYNSQDATQITISTGNSSTSSNNIITFTSISNIPSAPRILLIQCQRQSSSNTTLGLGSITLVG